MAAFFMAGTPADLDLKAGGPLAFSPRPAFQFAAGHHLRFRYRLLVARSRCRRTSILRCGYKAEFDNRVTKVHLLVTFAARLRFAATG